MQNNVDSSELNKKCGERLKQAILSTGTSQKDFAENIAHVTPVHLSAVIRGKRKLTEQLAALAADAAGVRKEWLLCEDDFKTEAEKEEAEQREILRPDGPAVTTLLLKRLLDRILASSAKDYGIQVTENQQNLLFAEVYHYTDYLIERMMKEALKNGSDREAKE